ncbi:hypothetical protein OIO90_001096 [Microbotryomycetes sp. JL221]|nr:hypothetical protein OIO90_001096 [Microbotryomycetes sp. JL221]
MTVQATYLPVRAYYRDRAKLMFVKIRDHEDDGRKQAHIVKRANKLLKHLQATNDGYIHAIRRTLETAFAQRGPAKHKLLQPFTQPDKSFTGPKFNPALASLVTSPLATTASRPPTLTQLSTPPTLPPRAFPDSEEARLLGPLIPQRINAIKRRYWNNQMTKLIAPIAVKTINKSSNTDDVTSEDLAPEDTLRAAGLSGVQYDDGMQRLAELERKAVVAPHHRPRAPRRSQSKQERNDTKGTAPASIRQSKTDEDRRVFAPNFRAIKWGRPKTISNRLIRRRYQKVLEQAPIVAIEDSRSKVNAGQESNTAAATTKPFTIAGLRFSIERSEHCSSKSFTVATEEEQRWFAAIRKDKK